jgi:hypothetical protein
MMHESNRQRSQEEHEYDEAKMQNASKRDREEECRFDRLLGETTPTKKKKKSAYCRTMEIIEGVLNDGN